MGRKTSFKRAEKDSLEKLEATSDYLRDEFDFNNDDDEN